MGLVVGIKKEELNLGEETVFSSSFSRSFLLLMNPFCVKCLSLSIPSLGSHFVFS